MRDCVFHRHAASSRGSRVRLLAAIVRMKHKRNFTTGVYRRNGYKIDPLTAFRS
jgi:hypothetical protein